MTERQKLEYEIEQLKFEKERLKIEYELFFLSQQRENLEIMKNLALQHFGLPLNPFLFTRRLNGLW